MISEWFLTIAQSLMTWLLGFLPDADWSDGIVVTAANSVASLMTAAAQIANWFPWPALGIALTATIGGYVAMFVMKIARVFLSHVPFVGGRG